MKPIKFNDTSDYQSMEVLGVEGVFTNLRIDEKTLPEGFYKYSLREGEEEFVAQICKHVMVNHAGDFITKKPIDLGPEGARDLGLDDWGFTGERVDFEKYFGTKYSLDCQISHAEAKRNEQLTRDPKARGRNSPPGKDEPVH